MSLPQLAPARRRKTSKLERARNFCAPLLRGNRPIWIQHVKQDGGRRVLKVTFFRANVCIDVDRLRRSIEALSPRVEFLGYQDGALSFNAPTVDDGFGLDKIYLLIYDTRR